jgi:hypothetical protein
LTIRYIPTHTRITTEKPHSGAFIFRGTGHANGNGWNALPAYDPTTSMTFTDQAAWGKKVAEHNARYSNFIAQPL